MTRSNIRCPKHGRMAATYVCQHIAAGLSQGVAVGFHWSAASAQEFPDAWCTDCNARCERCGWEWVGEAAEHLGAKLLCSGCYLDARRLALGR